MQGEQNSNGEPMEVGAQEQGGAAAGAADTGAAASAAENAAPDLQQLLDQAQARIAEMEEAFLRAKAETENMRRRAQEDIARAHKFAIEGFAEVLMPVKDSLEMALQIETPSVDALKEGVDITLKQLCAAFDKGRLAEINPAPGEKLDPMKHQAMSTVPSEQEPNTIINVLQKGYTISDRLLRPALVIVAQEKSS